MPMKIGAFDTDERAFIVAEIGNNHEGDYTLAEEMIGKAAEAGADAVKFQTFLTEHYVSRAVPERFAMLKRFELGGAELARLEKVARDAGVAFISTPFDLFSVDTLAPLVDVFKVASGDNTFYPLLEKIARKGKSTILSTGLAQLPQLKYAKALLERIWKENDSQAELAVLHCVTSYPVPAEEANLAMVRFLAEKLGGTVGYSDHTLGIEAAVASVGCGARIVEKHFTIDHNYSEFRDHQLSADPKELEEMVGRIRELEVLLGSGRDELCSCETEIRSVVRRSIVAVRDLAPGQVLTMDDITWVRPAGGIAPGSENLVLGRRLKSAVGAGEMIFLDQLEMER
jgi:sialic acid synthase SpsE